MTIVRLEPRAAEKPWGRVDLPPPFKYGIESALPIGEIIFDPPLGSDHDLLVKFLFTSDKLSIQVHPDDPAAHLAGARRGKDEAWIVLAAETGAAIGIGLKCELSTQALREAVTDGSIEQLLDCRPVKPGDCFYSPAGTIHAIGAGLSLVEIQQNCDLTYRLYDSGRPRELHVEQAVAVAIRGPAGPASCPIVLGPGRTHLAGGRAFQMERLCGAANLGLRPVEGGIWVLMLNGTVKVEGRLLASGEVWWFDEECDFQVASGTEFIAAYSSEEIQPIWQRLS